MDYEVFFQGARPILRENSRTTYKSTPSLDDKKRPKFDTGV